MKLHCTHTRTFSLGTRLIVLSGRSTRRTLSDFIVLRFFPAPLEVSLDLEKEEEEKPVWRQWMLSRSQALFL